VQRHERQAWPQAIIDADGHLDLPAPRDDPDGLAVREPVRRGVLGRDVERVAPAQRRRVPRRLDPGVVRIEAAASREPDGEVGIELVDRRIVLDATQVEGVLTYAGFTCRLWDAYGMAPTGTVYLYAVLYPRLLRGPGRSELITFSTIKGAFGTLADGIVTLPDGSQVPRLPAFTRWIWDGEFCGSVNARWQPGTTDLPPTCPGHMGYAVVPWKRRRGYATQALGLMLRLVAAETDLPWVAITTDLDNVVSQKVIEANGGQLVETFHRAPASGGEPALRYQVAVPRSTAAP
jgi:predicted acetyltransferase